MVSGFICGTNSFPEEEGNFDRRTRSADSSPQKTRSKSSNKNPYSSRGLDKFSALLVEIEEKRQQIYSQVHPDEISLVRFAYNGDHDFKPIVVKVKAKAHDHHHVHAPPKQLPKNDDNNIQKPALLSKLNSSSSMNIKEDIKACENEANNNSKNKKMGFSRKVGFYQWKKPNFYLPMIVILTLVFVVLFGRSFAIMCTSIGWYVIPSIAKNSKSYSKSRVSFKKKDYAIRRLSDKKLVTSEGTKSFKTSDGRS